MDWGVVSWNDHSAAGRPIGERAMASAPSTAAGVVGPKFRDRPDYARAVEVTAAVVLLVLLVPLMIFVAATLVACGRHPLFRQKRVGWREAEFTILKFRTLCADPCAPASPRPPSRLRRAQDRAFAVVSGVLRQSRIDELPQLVNIVRGDMAFIGPRPLIASDVAAMPPCRVRRFEVRPGLTGLAQVGGGQALGPADKLLLDLRYIETRSPGLDLWILGQTCLAPFRRDVPHPGLLGAVAHDAVTEIRTAPHNTHWCADG